MADTSRNNKEYPVSLSFLSNKSRAAHSRVYLSSIAWYVTSLLTLEINLPGPFPGPLFSLDYIQM